MADQESLNDNLIATWQGALLERARRILDAFPQSTIEELSERLQIAAYSDDAPKELRQPTDLEIGQEELAGVFAGVAARALDDVGRNPLGRLQRPAKDPDAIADAYIESRLKTPQGRTLHHWDGHFWAWAGTHYVQRSDEDQRAHLGQFVYKDIDLMEPGKTKKGGMFKTPATLWHINNTLDALKAAINLPANEVKPPQWLGEGAIGTRIAVQNGLLELATGELQPPSPRWFCFSALKTIYDPRARCPEWGAFLENLWGDDRQSVESLQEVLGYLLTTDTSQQKAFMIIGPPRSGKGTIGRVIATLLGPDATCRPSLSDFGYTFGIEPLIGKSLAIVSDARLDGNISAGLLAERLLAITGEDSMSVNRKFAGAWNGDLYVRFMILANELPRFRDPSGALPNRFIMLRTRKTFLGQEDVGLFDRLRPELAGILNWAIEGWTRLQIRGYFEQPKSALDLMDQLTDIANPLGNFIEEGCILDEERDTSISELYRCYTQWSKKMDTKPLPITLFGRDLRAALPGLTFFRPNGAQRRIRGIVPNWVTLNETGWGDQSA